jgi:antitoxin ParD1/3/4
MDQMNISITERLAGYVRRKVKTGRYNNASEVVREALRRMEEDDARALRLARPTVDDILTDLTGEQVAGIRGRVRAGLADIEAGNFATYEGRQGLQELADRVRQSAQRSSPRRVRAG